jgi:hypothetical protein
MTPRGPTVWKAVQENDKRFVGVTGSRSIWGIVANIMKFEAVPQGQELMVESFPGLRKVPEAIFGCKIVGVLVIRASPISGRRES